LQTAGHAPSSAQLAGEHEISIRCSHSISKSAAWSSQPRSEPPRATDAADAPCQAKSAQTNDVTRMQPATRTDAGQIEVDPAELFRVFPPIASQQGAHDAAPPRHNG